MKIQGRQLSPLTTAVLETQAPTALLGACLSPRSFLHLSNKRENRLLLEALDHVSSLILSARAGSAVSKLVFEILIKCFVNVKF